MTLKSLDPTHRGPRGARRGRPRLRSIEERDTDNCAATTAEQNRSRHGANAEPPNHLLRRGFSSVAAARRHAPCWADEHSGGRRFSDWGGRLHLLATAAAAVAKGAAAALPFPATTASSSRARSRQNAHKRRETRRRRRRRRRRRPQRRRRAWLWPLWRSRARRRQVGRAAISGRGGGVG